MISVELSAFSLREDLDRSFCLAKRTGLDGEDGYKHGTEAVWNRDPNQLEAGRPCGKLAERWPGGNVDCMTSAHVRIDTRGRADFRSNGDGACRQMSRKMMERYSHAENEAKRQAVDALNMGLVREDFPIISLTAKIDERTNQL
jgi:hypothetical protein